MKIMWNREKMTRRAHKTLSWMNIAVLKWALLKNVFIGKEKRKWNKVKSSTHVRCKIF
jgi:hypothetical protein